MNRYRYSRGIITPWNLYREVFIPYYTSNHQFERNLSRYVAVQYQYGSVRHIYVPYNKELLLNLCLEEAAVLTCVGLTYCHKEAFSFPIVVSMVASPLEMT